MSVKTVCESNWDAYLDDCSGFVKAVATELGVTLESVDAGQHRLVFKDRTGATVQRKY
jgi:hypothetical protein